MGYHSRMANLLGYRGAMEREKRLAGVPAKSSFGGFGGESMPKDLHGFATRAIGIAGRAGEQKREAATISQLMTQRAAAATQQRQINAQEQAAREQRRHELELQEVGADSRMAEVSRQQEGATRRQAMIGAGKAAGRDTSGSGLRGAGTKSAGMMPKSTRLKSFDYANKAMGEMFPGRINPGTNKPFTSQEWTEGINELADQREAYAGQGVQQPEEEPTGLQGRGAVYMPSTGQRWDVGAGGDITRSLTEQPEQQGGLPMAPETVVPAETVSLSALEKWRKRHPRRAKTRLGGEDPIKTFMRSLTKPIDRSRLGKPVDYMNIFGSQQRF